MSTRRLTALCLAKSTVLMQLEWPLFASGGLVVIMCATVLAAGRFRWLDLVVKVVLALLAVSTVVAAAATIPRADFGTFRLWPGDIIGTAVPFAFVLALVGWMPSAIDISVWSSLWTLAKNEASGSRVTVRDALLDFRIGYVGTGFFAFAFLILGAGVMFGSGASFSSQGGVFATQLVELYSSTLGQWLRPVVIVAVLTTMLSTSITVVDGFPRGIERSVLRLAVEGNADAPSGGRIYWISIGAIFVSMLIVLAFFVTSLTAMVDFATIVSFVTAPILGYLNLRAVLSDVVAPEHRPGRTMVVLSWVGIVLLSGTAVVYGGTLLR